MLNSSQDLVKLNVSLLERRKRLENRRLKPKPIFFLDEDGVLRRKQVILPIETLIDVLSFCSRRTLNKRMRLVNRQFMTVCNENIRSVFTMSDLVVETYLKYGWEKRFRGLVQNYCCIPPHPGRLAKAERNKYRDRICSVQTWFRILNQDKIYSKWKSIGSGGSISLPEFYSFVCANRYIRFSSVTFYNIQQDYVIDFLKYVTETTEIFDHSRFYVKFWFNEDCLRLKSDVMFVPRQFGDPVIHQWKTREIVLDEFVTAECSGK
ncbi:hypothetical protein Ddc_16312 [Ditylenchus destructor]|nr:hypothetical protein Ddc_16312 [Ditylenchus destructor]